MGKLAGHKVSGIFFRIGEREEAGLASKLKSGNKEYRTSKWKND